MKLRLAVHKFASCDGCQLGLLDAGPDLLRLAGQVEIVHFAEAGILDPEAQADIALVEGSITTAADRARIQAIRRRSRLLVALGACAGSGGIQALRNDAGGAWLRDVYPHPDWLEAEPDSLPLSALVKVDQVLPGCPVSTGQLLALLRDLILGVVPRDEEDSLCLECKRRGQVCVMVARGEPCLGPVTHAGCGAVCPGQGRGCYGCSGPAAQGEPAHLARYWTAQGEAPGRVARRFRLIHSQAPALRAVVEGLQAGEDEHD